VRRERKEGREPKAHGHKTARARKEQQEDLISAIPSMWPRVARNLLQHFSSIKSVITASGEDHQIRKWSLCNFIRRFLIAKLKLFLV